MAVYWRLNGREYYLACDAFTRVSDNLWAIAKTIEATRQAIRYGVVSGAEAFRGYEALPAPEPAWRDVLKLGPNATLEEARAAYATLAKLCHPDRGDSLEQMAAVNAAWAAAKKELG